MARPEPPRQMTCPGPGPRPVLSSADRCRTLSEVSWFPAKRVYLQALGGLPGRRAAAPRVTPEIGLYPQLIDRCWPAFGDRVLGLSQRVSAMLSGIRVWSASREQRSRPARDCVATRSAFFLPLAPLSV